MRLTTISVWSALVWFWSVLCAGKKGGGIQFPEDIHSSSNFIFHFVTLGFDVLFYMGPQPKQSPSGTVPMGGQKCPLTRLIKRLACFEFLTVFCGIRPLWKLPLREIVVSVHYWNARFFFMVRRGEPDDWDKSFAIVESFRIGAVDRCLSNLLSWLIEFDSLRGLSESLN